MKTGISMVPEDRKQDGIIADMSVEKNMTLSNLDSYTKAADYVDTYKGKN